MIEQGRTQLHQLNVLRDQLVGGAKDLPALRANVTAAVAAIHAYASDARAAASSSTVAGSAAQAQLQQVDEVARANIASLTHDIFERRMFDPYLRFASKDDEEAYRRREEETKRYIDQQLGRHTPQGDLNAAAANVAQLSDAEAHGAGNSPAFKAENAKANSTFDTLREAATAAGVPTDEADRIAARSDGRSLPSSRTTSVEPTPKYPSVDIGDAVATFRAAGVIQAPDGAGHGVQQQADSSAAKGRTTPG